MQASIRVKLYMLASGLFEQPEASSSDFLFAVVSNLLRSTLTDWPYRNILEALERDLVEDLDSVADLRAEHERLFSGANGGLVSPYADFWLKGGALREGRELMASHGMASFGGSPGYAGHLLAELEFMACLVADDGNTRDTQRHFVRRHLVRWLPRFAQEVLSEARLARYRLAAGLLLRLLAVEGELLKPALPAVAADVRQAA